MRLVVAVSAAAAAAIVAGVVYATRQDPAQPKKLCDAGSAFIVAGIATPHAAQVRAAMKKPPKQAAVALEQLAQENPRDPAVQFNEARALICAGYVADAVTPLRRAKRWGRNTQYQVSADNLLHPQFFTEGYPPFTYSGNDPLLVQGQLEQRRYHPVTAERLWARAARLHPESPDAQVAAAVGRFDMDDLSASFSHLGPLAKRFPRSQTVRFHLGLLLAWTGQRSLAVQEFRRARALGPRTELGKSAQAFLRGLVTGGTSGAKR